MTRPRLLIAVTFIALSSVFVAPAARADEPVVDEKSFAGNGWVLEHVVLPANSIITMRADYASSDSETTLAFWIANEISPEYFFVALTGGGNRSITTQIRDNRRALDVDAAIDIPPPIIDSGPGFTVLGTGALPAGETTLVVAAAAVEPTATTITVSLPSGTVVVDEASGTRATLVDRTGFSTAPGAFFDSGPLSVDYAADGYRTTRATRRLYGFFDTSNPDARLGYSGPGGSVACNCALWGNPPGVYQFSYETPLHLASNATGVGGGVSVRLLVVDAGLAPA